MCLFFKETVNYYIQNEICCCLVCLTLDRSQYAAVPKVRSFVLMSVALPFFLVIVLLKLPNFVSHVNINEILFWGYDRIGT